jgi:FtsP/CotA-like multicopper oxidase with cupredoxin domain
MPISRRKLLGAGAAAGGAGLLAAAGSAVRANNPGAIDLHASHLSHTTGNNVVGQVDHKKNGFDPHDILTDWERGKTSTLPDGRTLREFEIVAEDKEIEIAPGVMFPAWTYNGRVPGPTLRVTEGERIRITFVNSGSHPHSLHFHGIHHASMDGTTRGNGLIAQGERFVYEFDAAPMGCHHYHCHALPLKRHVHKGLYGGFIVDPDPKRHPDHEAQAKSRLLDSDENKGWQEFFMMMNGFDTNFDDENEFYCVNSIPFAYLEKPIRVEKDKPIRIYLVNMTEFDPINSLHLHANFFDFYDHGTQLEPTLKTVDTVMMCQAQRGIIEISFKDFDPGLYMFHAHQSEFAELGWMSHFEVV